MSEHDSGYVADRAFEVSLTLPDPAWSLCVALPGGSGIGSGWTVTDRIGSDRIGVGRSRTPVPVDGRVTADRMCEHEPVSVTSPQLHDKRKTLRRVAPLAVALSLTAIVRVIFLLRDNTLSADEAVTGIMARNIAAGRHLYLYFAGQNYNSAVEQYPQAGLFALGAPQNAFVLRLPQVALSVFSCWLIYQVASRMFGDSWRPHLAALLFALGPIFQITRGSTTTGSYTTQLALGLLTVWCALALAPTLPARRRCAAAGLLGFALTGTLYLTASGYFLVLPAIVWAVPVLIRCRLWRFFGVGAVVGGLVPLAYTVRTRVSIFPHLGTDPSTPASRLRDLLDPVGRMFLGLAHSYGVPGLPLPAGRLLLWLALAALVVTAWAHRRSIRAIASLRPAGRNPIDIPVIALIAAAVGYVASKYAYFTIDPRYLYTTTPALILALAALAGPTAPNSRLVERALSAMPASWRNSGGSWTNRSWRMGTVGVVSILLLVLVGGPTLVMLSHSAVDSNGDTTALPSTGLDADMKKAATQLELDHIRYVYATYWLATPMDFLADGRLTAVTYGEANRFPIDRARADAAPVGQTAWLDVTSSAVLPTALRRHHVGFRHRRFGRITIYQDFSANVRPFQLGLRGP